MSDAPPPSHAPGSRGHLALVPPAEPAAADPAPQPRIAGPASLAGIVDTAGLTPEWAAIADRYATAEKVQGRLEALSRIEAARGHAEVQALVHGNLVSALLHLAPAHTDCTTANCPTCATLESAVSMVLAEREIRQGRA
ncbi:hypothetical protein [Paractinoplanes atraurantiacus]|uniref:Uncharacterized protein n=1 Tax=Paractinoplanes atraurantiacus TaxID=1036182 RepID=A0A285KJQ2_9ACTN|nr:hypothetical protein [Actinoplanes atraurantiacus]SNY72872.1 hypothetical protein SAMN05421748_14438 [Actinoplanes atraurantiacus]